MKYFYITLFTILLFLMFFACNTDASQYSPLGIKQSTSYTKENIYFEYHKDYTIKRNQKEEEVRLIRVNYGRLYM